MSRQSRARLMLITSMVIFGTIGLFVRHIHFSSAQIALYRAVIAIVLIGAYLLVTGQRLNLRSLGRELVLLIASGAAMGFNWILLFEAYKYTTVSVATLSYYFAPVIVTVACPILFREKMGPVQWICFAMSTLGIVLITGLGDLSAGSNHIAGILFGLGAACLYATVILLNKSIRRVAGIQRTFMQFMAAAAVLFPYVLFTEGFHVSIGMMDVVLMLVVGVVHSGIAYCMYFSSLKELPGQKAAILSYVDPLVAVLLSVTILGEPMSLMQVVGGALILGFTMLNELAPAKEAK